MHLRTLFFFPQRRGFGSALTPCRGFGVGCVRVWWGILWHGRSTCELSGTYLRTLRNFFRSELGLGTKIVAGGLSGTIAQGIANPCDLVKVRMIGAGLDGATAAPQYRWFTTALTHIIKTEGVAGLYKGVGANIGRASTLAAAEMSSYDALKPIVKDYTGLVEGALELVALSAAGKDQREREGGVVGVATLSAAGLAWPVI